MSSCSSTRLQHMPSTESAIQLASASEITSDLSGGSGMVVRNIVPGIPLPYSIIDQIVLSHLGETRLAELVINQREQCRHDRTPLFDQPGKLDWQLFQGGFAPRQKWLLQPGKPFRSEHVKEISSRIRGGPAASRLAPPSGRCAHISRGPLE